MWLIQVLVDELPGIEAARQLQAVQAAIAPHTRPGDAKRYQRDLERVAYPPAPAEPMPKFAHDPQAAAEWFRSQGAYVVTTTESA